MGVNVCVYVCVCQRERKQQMLETSCDLTVVFDCFSQVKALDICEVRATSSKGSKQALPNENSSNILAHGNTRHNRTHAFPLSRTHTHSHRDKHPQNKQPTFEDVVWHPRRRRIGSCTNCSRLAVVRRVCQGGGGSGRGSRHQVPNPGDEAGGHLGQSL